MAEALNDAYSTAFIRKKQKKYKVCNVEFLIKYKTKHEARHEKEALNNRNDKNLPRKQFYSFER